MGLVRVRRAALVALIVGLAACSGGDDSRDASTEVSTNSLSFDAASPDAPTPPAQTLTATFGPGTAYVEVLRAGTPIADLTYSVSGNSAQIVVTPASPTTLGAGVFTGAVSVTAYGCANAECSRLVPGNAQVVNVTFNIPPIVRFVAPYVGVTNRAQAAIIRGQGFTQFAVQNVTFGATAASSFSVESDTEIRASYPALAAGSYAVQIDAPSSPGAVVSTANLVVVDPPDYAAATLAYPSATPQVRRLLYDAARGALLLAVDDSAIGGALLRYAFRGSWGSPSSVALADLRDVAFSIDGAQLLALADATMTQVDPTSLATGTVTSGPVPTAGEFLKSLAVGNDGDALITTGHSDSTNTPLYAYTTRSPAFVPPSSAISLNNATLGVSADGSLMTIVQGHATLTSAPIVYQYVTAARAFAATAVALNQNAIAPVLDRAATRIVLNGTQVYDSSFNLLGTLPEATAAVIVRPDATRAYTFDATTSQVLSFDLTASPAGAAFPQVGVGTTLPGNPGAGVQMAISPDGDTLFLAGSDQVVVQPSPP